MVLKLFKCLVSAALIFILSSASAYGPIMSLGHPPSGGGSTPAVGSKWASWTEASEAGLYDSNTFVCFMENTSGSGDETGQGGGLVAANLVLTQSGGGAGASGTPPLRELDGVDDWFIWTETACDNFLDSKTTFTLASKWNGFNDNASHVWLIGGTVNCQLSRSGDGKLFARWIDGGGAHTATTTDVIPDTGDVYFFMWADGTNLRAAFGTSRFTKLSQIPAGQRVELAGWAATSPDAGGFPVGSDQAGNRPSASCYWFVASKLCLIDNAS